ncbi:MAG: MFS transporter [Micrococcales bacterium]|nr:MFS transporter [Micrococcales bacterium]
MSEVALGVRARWALPWIFFLMGVVSMAWVPRIPEIKSALGLSDGEFGLVLVSSSLGAVIGAQLAGQLIQRFGSRNLLRVTQLALPFGVLLMGLAPNVLVLALGLFCLGFGAAGMDIPGNAQAVVIEKLIGKKFLASLHGAWSIGAFVAAVFGGLVANFLSPQLNLMLLAMLSLLVFVPLTERMLDSSRDEHMGLEGKDDRKLTWFGNKVNLLWIFAFGSLGALVAEGAAADWSGILLSEHMGVEKGLTASVFASFSLSMIISRFTADWLMDRFTPQRVVFFGGVVGGVLWSASILIAIPLSQTNQLLALVLINVGFLAAGAGIGPMFPAFILGASRLPGVPASLGIARISVISIAGYFLGPTVTGFISELTSLPTAMMYPGLALILAGFAGKGLTPKK